VKAQKLSASSGHVRKRVDMETRLTDEHHQALKLWLLGALLLGLVLPLPTGLGGLAEPVFENCVGDPIVRLRADIALA